MPNDVMVDLGRFAYTPMGTFGLLRVEDFQCYTLELPWGKNPTGHSCIPCGTYPLSYGMFYGGDGVGGKLDYPAYILEVPGRSEIKIHIANIYTQLLGCIAPGTALGYYKDLWAVLNSSVAHKQFMEVMNKRSGKINVYNYIGGIVA